MYYWHMGNMGLFGGIGMILFWGLFIWLIVWIVSQNKKQTEDPKSILKKRLAKGEISGDEYDKLVKKL